jgi:hypothetical protein
VLRSEASWEQFSLLPTNERGKQASVGGLPCWVRVLSKSNGSYLPAVRLQKLWRPGLRAESPLKP